MLKRQASVGTCIEEMETPLLMIDLEAMERNIQRMAGHFAGVGANLRPHAKTHKTPALARLQIEAGAIGICCGNLDEAEVMIDAGIDGVLVTREIVLPGQLARVAELSRRADIIVVVDDEGVARRLDEAATAASVQVGVLVDVDVGLGRCGVQPGESARGMAYRVDRAKGLRFRGIMGYEGAMHSLVKAERERRCREAMQDLVRTRRLIEKDGIAVEIVSGGGTTTYRTVSSFPEITEAQAGSYITYDAEYRSILPEFECALSVLTTVISRPSPSRVTTDAGKKKLTEDAGLPVVKDGSGLTLIGLSEEHGIIDKSDSGREVSVGDQLQIIPSHGCTTFNLYDRVYGFRGDRLEVVWDVAARGT